MFDFDFWFAGLVGTTELIADPNAFRRAWILRDAAVTSIASYDELVEHLAGDLLLGECVARFEGVLQEAGGLEAVTGFLEALVTLDETVQASQELQNPEALLASPEWTEFVDSARRVTELPAAKVFRAHG